MTNYNERLDEILAAKFATKPDGGAWCTLHLHKLEVGVCRSCEAKQALTSLIKELVTEAKPYGKRQFRELIEDAWYEAPTAAAGFGRIEAIHNQYEQNLLKALEEL